MGRMDFRIDDGGNRHRYSSLFQEPDETHFYYANLVVPLIHEIWDNSFKYIHAVSVTNRHGEQKPETHRNTLHHSSTGKGEPKDRFANVSLTRERLTYEVLQQIALV
jgi:hypothetical protein